MTKVVIISGETSPYSRLTGILEYVVGALSQEEMQVDHISVHQLPAEALIHAKFDSPEIVQANQMVEAADAVIVLTPVYKASYTGVLKTYLDLLPQKGLVGKPVLPLVLGGTFGHLLVIDYALKPVLSALGATHLLQGVYVLDTQIQRLDANQFQLDAEAEQRLQTAVHTLAGVLKG